MKLNDLGRQKLKGSHILQWAKRAKLNSDTLRCKRGNLLRLCILSEGEGGRCYICLCSVTSLRVRGIIGEYITCPDASTYSQFRHVPCLHV